MFRTQGSPHIVKTGWLDFSFSWLKGEVRENLGDFRKSIQILTFLSPLHHVPLSFTKTNVLHYDLKKDAINEFGIKYWTFNIKNTGHISGTWELLLCEYWRKSMIIGEKNTDLKRLTGRLKLRFLTEIGWFHWNQVWFGEPWLTLLFIMSCDILEPISSFVPTYTFV